MKTVFFTWALFFCFSSGAVGQKQVMDSLYNLSLDKLASNDFAEATDLLLAARKIAEADKNLRVLCYVQMSLGKIGIITENNKAAEEAITSGLNYCAACKDTLSVAKLLTQQGVLKIKQQQNDSAVVLFKRSAENFLLKKDTASAAKAFAKIGNVLELEKKYLDAQKYYLEFYNIAKKDPESLNFLNANIFLTGNYLYLDQTKKALFHNNLVLRSAQKLDANYEYSEALRNDALIYRQLGQYELAFDKLNHFAQYYQDTLMSKVQLDQAEAMRAKYEAEKKEAQIALQGLQLGRERFKFGVVIAGLAVALMVGGLLFQLTRRLRKRNEEKEFLIKEIHHRVKNNLQILSSLLHLQSRQITDDAALHAVREGQNRVDAMGLIHQKLYMGDNVARVEMKDYLEQFGQNMLDSFGIEEERVNIEYNLQPLYLDVDTAIPLCLIINELVTNALKYAFPGEQKGVISIALWKDDKNRLCLKVSDNGVGQANAQKDEKSTAFGANLVQMLSKKLKGKLEVPATEQGYATQIVFEKHD